MPARPPPWVGRCQHWPPQPWHPTMSQATPHPPPTTLLLRAIRYPFHGRCPSGLSPPHCHDSASNAAKYRGTQTPLGAETSLTAHPGLRAPIQDLGHLPRPWNNCLTSGHLPGMGALPTAREEGWEEPFLRTVSCPRMVFGTQHLTAAHPYHSPRLRSRSRKLPWAEAPQDSREG